MTFSIIVFILNLVCIALFGYFYYKFESYLIKKPKAYWLFVVPFWLLLVNEIFVFCALTILIGGN